MPIAVEPLPIEDVPAPNRKRFTRRDADFLRDNGLLDGRYELIDGEIISKMGQNPPHASVIRALTSWLTALFGYAYVQFQLPIFVGDPESNFNDPEPDAAVMRLPDSEYFQRHPRPGELLLVVEVSDSTLRFDRVAKAALYARANIVEYWIVDVTGRQVFVHRRPGLEGYAEITAYQEDEAVATLARPNDAVRVGDLLPPLP